MESSDKSTPRKPPSLVLPSIECPLICEQGPSKPSSPTVSIHCDSIPADLITRIQMFSSQFDHARLSPNYATSDLGSSARSSFSTASWMAYRDRSMDFDETGKELISPFECDTACSVSPSFSLSPNSYDHFSFDARSVASLCNSTNNLNNFLTVAPLEPRERSRSESDMSPLLNISALSRSTDSVPFYCKTFASTAPKPNQETKRSSSTPPPTTSARIDSDESKSYGALPQFPASCHDDKELLNSWTRTQLLALQTANFYDQAVSNMLSASAKLEVPPNPLKLFVPSSPSSSASGTVVPPNDDSSTSREDLGSSRSQLNQFVCSLCGQAFSVHDRLAKHIASRHRQRSCTLDDASKIHKCAMCSKSFSRSDMLTRHMRLHTGAKPYSCPTCSQVFSRSDHLSTHLRTHTGEKPYGCPLCSYSASRRDMISRHMRTHSMTESSTTIDIAAPIGDLSIRSASTSPLPQKVPVIVGIGSGELSAFKPIKSSSSNNHLSVSAPFQSLSLSTPSSPMFSRSSSSSSSTQYDYASLDKNNGLFLK